MLAVYIPSILTNLLRDRLQKINSWVTPKFSRPENTNRIGFLGGINSKFSDIQWYTNIINEMGQLQECDIELRHKKTWEQEYNTNTYFVYFVQSKSKFIDMKLRSSEAIKL